MPLSDTDVTAALKGVTDPNTGKDLVAGKAVKSVRVAEGQIAVEIQLGVEVAADAPEASAPDGEVDAEEPAEQPAP